MLGEYFEEIIAVTGYTASFVHHARLKVRLFNYVFIQARLQDINSHTHSLTEFKKERVLDHSRYIVLEFYEYLFFGGDFLLEH